MNGPAPRAERWVTYGTAWFDPVDTVTGRRPLTPLHVELDRLVDQDWVVTGIAAVMTASGAVSYPGLGRSRDPLAAGPRRYRARFAADGYLPLYRADGDGEEFDAYPYDDMHPPARDPVRAEVGLAPASGYLFAAEIPVLYGEVVTSSGSPVEDALVEAVMGSGAMLQARTERTVSDRRGGFALPLRWAPSDADTVVVATFRRGGAAQAGAIAVRVPGGLTGSHRIEIR